MVLYVEQVVNFILSWHSDHKNRKLKYRMVKNETKDCFAIRMEWVKCSEKRVRPDLRRFKNWLQGVRHFSFICNFEEVSSGQAFIFVSYNLLALFLNFPDSFKRLQQ